MSYKWRGMRKLTWEEVKERFEKGDLAGCYKLLRIFSGTKTTAVSSEKSLTVWSYSCRTAKR